MMEKTLDMQGIREDAEAADKAEEEAKAEEEIAVYTHEFKKPFQWRGAEYGSLTFDWSATDGHTYLAIEQELVMKGRALVNPAFTGDFLAGMAAWACTERSEKGKRVIDAKAVKSMPLQDFLSITRRARSFLLRAE